MKNKKGFCIYTDTLCQGPIPCESDENGKIVVYATEREAQVEIADSLIMKLEAFKRDGFEFEDAITTGEYVVPVDVHDDGSITDDQDRKFGPKSPGSAEELDAFAEQLGAFGETVLPKGRT